MTSLAAIHVAKKQLGLEDDDYRAILARVTGKSSARDLDEAGRGKVLAEFRRLGFVKAPSDSLDPGRAQTGPGGRSRRLDGKYAPKLQALWIAGWNLGIVRDKRDAALLAFVKRQTGLDHTRFLHHPADAARAIEALKGWLARDGKVNWEKSKTFRAGWQHADGYRIAWAQWLKLYDAAPTLRWFKFGVEIRALSGKVPEAMESRDWVRVMNTLGERIRAKGEGAK
jgi:hypothetical protein